MLLSHQPVPLPTHPVSDAQAPPAPAVVKSVPPTSVTFSAISGPTSVSQICAFIARGYKEILPLRMKFLEGLFIRSGVAVTDPERKTHLLRNILGRIGVEYVDIGIPGRVLINNQNWRARGH